ncbi:farnesyl pyrophosphate synthase-like isoform X2 [Triticum dicoccoides]|uniref:farnesyl pyrophosphate synthase-like isoform X2 n=1 Tax=Triticum dicoccoides TaxID=85692 RepID=UPI0018900524|nr:farnesyl pyrophosphate synthase-like isoform X2 [Triticum dicoccoides]
MAAAAVALSNGSGGDSKAEFAEIYSRLKEEMLEDPAFEFTDESLQWIDRMLDYNVLGGKCNRGLSVIDSYKTLKGVDVLRKEETFLACTLGWCIEWLQAYFLVLDDIMDNSQTRRGQPCWFRVPQVEFKTASGQLLDLITTHEGEKDLTKYNLNVHRRIVQYKTAYYSFYLPVACALLLSGENLDNFGDVKNILVEMGTYFQVQDDYLDCFGDPESIGKIGTDIEDYKCSWLVVQALELADESQKGILLENYGKSEPESVAKVKDLYKELDLETAFHKYERESYNKLIADIEAQPSKAVQKVLMSFLEKIYKRQK